MANVRMQRTYKAKSDSPGCAARLDFAGSLVLFVGLVVAPGTSVGPACSCNQARAEAKQSKHVQDKASKQALVIAGEKCRLQPLRLLLEGVQVFVMPLLPELLVHMLHHLPPIEFVHRYGSGSGCDRTVQVTDVPCGSPLLLRVPGFSLYIAYQIGQVKTKEIYNKYNKNHGENDDTLAFSEVCNKTLDTKKINSLKLFIQLINEKDIQFSDIILGKGAQGVVTKGKYLGSLVAIKSVQKKNRCKLILREIMLLDKIRHPNIISIMAACSSITQFHIVMEYFKSDSLFDIIFKPQVKKNYFLSLGNKNKIAYQISCALTFLHLQPVPILHRDIKPGNILVNENFETKLCDLGLSTCKSVIESLQSTQADTIRGTYLFMAPEILLHRQRASKSSDVWAFACTLVELFNEETVWETRNFFNGWCCAKENLADKNVPNMNKVPFYLTEMLTKCFNYDATQRPDMIELLNLFERIQT
ncbi:LOW QUALITY PROTEIN: probable serine/threonine-protein kinase DDB_G0267514 [Temnothorax longispinosus]|uniref:LOW QUALITY PROTEIN: probable serine/threonine-protein kinase DDB_G0267514 n=1 Tax=Temnothorax longispinosus TaxID=300112 RepID=UPI003A99CAC0